MRNVTSAFLKALGEDNRNYQVRVPISLADGTVLNGTITTIDETTDEDVVTVVPYLTNENVWEDGIKIDDAVSSDSVFQVGAAIINQATVVINNIYDEYSAYDFSNAVVEIYVGLTDLGTSPDEEIKMGVFNVDEAEYNGSFITLRCLDNMSKFDRVYDTTLSYPASLGAIVRDACTKCGVTLSPNSGNFPHNSFNISTKPSGDSATYRQVISWAAQISGCYARFNSIGELEIKWFDTSLIDGSNDGLDGGTFDNSWLLQYMNTEDGMEVVSSGKEIDNQYPISNSVDFEFNGIVYPYVYVSTYSHFQFGSSPTYATYGDLNLSANNYNCSTAILKQHIAVSSHKAIKVRFTGYISDTQLTPENCISYEVFFVDDGRIIINYLSVPTYTMTTRITENYYTYNFTPRLGIPIVLVRDPDDNNKWKEGSYAYQSGDTADGGSFNPWDTGYEYDGGNFTTISPVHHITSSYQHNLSTDDVVITQVVVSEKVNKANLPDYANQYSDTSTYSVGAMAYYDGELYKCIVTIATAESFNRDHWEQVSTIDTPTGTAGYTIVIENNDLIQDNNGAQISAWLGTLLIGLQFRKGEVTHPNDPTFEAGDVAYYYDRKGNRYTMLVSSTSFSVGNSQRTVSSAETPAKNSQQRFSESTRNYVAMREDVSQQVGFLEQRMKDAGGLYCTVEQQTSGNIIHYHDKPLLSESTVDMKFTDAGFFVTADYQTPQSQGGPTWYGMTVDGAFIASIVDTIDLFFDYAHGGELTLGGNNNVNGVLRINDSNNNEIGAWTKDGFSGQGTFNFVSYYHPGYTDIGWYTTRIKEGKFWFFDNIENAYLGCIIADYIPQSVSGLNVPPDLGIHGGGQLDLFSYARYVSPSSTQWEGSATTNKTASIRILQNRIEVKAQEGRNYSLIPSGSNNPITSDITLLGKVTIGDRYQGDYLYVFGDLTVAGTKPRLVQDTKYGDRYLYCYETPTPYFGDIGTGCTDENGEAVIGIDDIFDETVNTNVEYSVFLQKEGPGDLWIDEKERSYFVVKGTPGLKFSWELKAVQRGYENYRLDDDAIKQSSYINDEDVGLSMEEDLAILDAEDLFDEAI